jgi:hypothetical protein
MSVPHWRVVERWESSWVLRPKSVIFREERLLGSETMMFSRLQGRNMQGFKSRWIMFRECR